MRRVWAPGRVNLIGEHTDTTGGLVMPMAIELGLTAVVEVGGSTIHLVSDDTTSPLRVDLPCDRPAEVTPQWGRYVAGVAHVLEAHTGFTGTLSSTLPSGAGLSSSAALEVAVALALGAEGTAAQIAEWGRQAETLATGVRCGIMDQLASAGGIDGHAMLIDCSTLEITPVRIPEGFAVSVIHSGQHRALATSEYSERRAQCEAAEASIGPLRSAGPDDWHTIGDPVVAARARHVIGENTRVREFAAALSRDDIKACGDVLDRSHASLRDDFDVSTDRVDAVVELVRHRPGVTGCRITGAGFGGCVVALHHEDTDLEGLSLGGNQLRTWRVRASRGAFAVDD